MFDSSLFFFNDTATTEIYTLSLHDALPIFERAVVLGSSEVIRPEDLPESVLEAEPPTAPGATRYHEDRKSTRLNSSHLGISYAVFCLKKKNSKADRGQTQDCELTACGTLNV